MSAGKGFQITYDDIIESAIEQITSLLKSDYSVSKRSLALLLLQGDKDTKDLIAANEGSRLENIETIVRNIESKYAHPLNYVIRLRLQKECSEIVSSAISTHEAPVTPFREKLSRIMINPITGVPILLIIMYLGLYQFVGTFGAGVLVDLIEGTLFGKHINPFFIDLFNDNIPWKAVQDMFVHQDYGVITLGITYAVAIILPIVGTFFLVFSVIEDTGYLPRLSLLVDSLFKKIGLSGRAVIPMVLGLGCDTMATMVTRTQETRRERIIATLLLALAIPCAAQLGVILGIMSGKPLALIVWLLVVILSFIVIGLLASKVLPGSRPSFYMELPPLRWPKISNVLTKTYTRMVWYFKEVLPIFILVSLLMWFLDLIGVMKLILRGIEPLVNFIGLPDETADVFLFGFFRRDYGAAGLYDMKDYLTGVEITVAAVTLTLFVPCIAQFLMMIKERGVKTAVAILAFVIVYAFGIGSLLNQILTESGASL